MIGMTETEQDIWTEFSSLLNQAAFVYTTTLTSIDVYGPQFRKQIGRSAARPETPIGLNSGPIPGNPEGVTFAEVSQAEYGEATDTRGLLARQTGVSWLVFTYASWEDNIRPRLAAARGVKRTDVMHPVMGDLGKIRNDAVHLGARATTEKTGRCSTLKWFTVGDEIFIERWMVAAVMAHFGLAKAAPTGPYMSFRI